MYADDITLYTEAETAEQAMEALGSDAQSTLDWYRQNRLIVNLKKTQHTLWSLVESIGKTKSVGQSLF